MSDTTGTVMMFIRAMDQGIMIVTDMITGAEEFITARPIIRVVMIGAVFPMVVGIMIP